jgi:hypothetical protein
MMLPKQERQSKAASQKRSQALSLHLLAFLPFSYHRAALRKGATITPELKFSNKPVTSLACQVA